MADPQDYKDFIEPPPRGFVPPPQTPSDTFGLQPSAPPPAVPPQPQPGPQDRVIPSGRSSNLPFVLAGYDSEADAIRHNLGPAYADAVAAFKNREGQSATAESFESWRARQSPATPSVPSVIKTDKNTGRTYSPALIREQMVQRLMQHGMSKPLATGILDAAEKNESGLNPYAVGDNGTSFSIFQAHGTRAVDLAQFAEKQGKPPSDPIVNADWLVQQYHGGDPISTEHFHELEQAAAKGDVATVAALHEKYFERPKQGGDGGRVVDRNTVAGPFNENAQALVNQLMRQMQEQQPAMNEAIAEAKDIHQMTRAMAAKWMSDSDKPPQNMRQAWSQWGQVAGVLALFGGLVGRHSMNAAVNAAGEMMQSATAADQKSYDIAYKQWSDHLDRGMKAIALLNKEAMDIISDQKLSYDQIISQLSVLSTAAGLQQILDPASAANLQKQAEILKSKTDIIRAQNVTSDYRNKVASYVADPKNAGTLVAGEPPPEVKNKLLAEAQRDAMPKGGTDVQDFYQQWKTELTQEWLADPKNAGPDGKPYTEETMPQKAKLEIDGQARAKAGLPGAVAAQKEATQEAAAGSFTDADVHYWATIVKSGGALPPYLGRGTYGAMLVQRIMKEVGSSGTAGDFIEAHASVKADSTSLSNMTKMADAATSFERTAKLNFDKALSLAPTAVPSTLGPFFNRWIMEGEKMFGDPDVPPYVTAMLTGANEYAKIMSGTTGAQGSTVDSRREAAELFSPYLSMPQIKNVIAVAEYDMNNRKQSLYGQIDDIKSRLRAPGSTAPTATQGQAPRAETIPAHPDVELRNVKAAIAAGAPRAAVRAEFIKRGGDPTAFDKEVP